MIGSYDRKIECSLCNRRLQTRYHLALHSAMKEDKPHQGWRTVHDLPIDYENMEEAHEIASQIKKIFNRSHTEKK